MVLSNDLISQFAKITKDDKKTKSETTVYGTTVEYNGEIYVQLDGSDLLTPIETTTDMKPGERVTVLIKDHTATATGNISSPSASKDDVIEIGNKITDFEIVIADKVSTKEFDAQVGRIDNLVSDNITIKEELTAASANIEDLKVENVNISEKLTAAEAEIENLDTTKLDADIADIKFATIEGLNATNASIHNLEADYGEFKDLTTNHFTAIDADIKKLDTEKLSAEQADLKYATIDFANIGDAAIESFFSKSGMISDLVVEDGTITGSLVGVTIKGDLIEGGTVIADKLVIKGSDGLYYKLNTDGVTTESEQTEYNSLNGSVITAKSITATKISVDDLVAFDATIGGFKITENSLYSGVKESIDNSTPGVYLDDQGQMSIGDSNGYLKYYKDEEGNYKLDISASNISMGSSNKTIEEYISEEIVNNFEDTFIGDNLLLFTDDPIIENPPKDNLLLYTKDISISNEINKGWYSPFNSLVKTEDGIKISFNNINDNLNIPLSSLINTDIDEKTYTLSFKYRTNSEYFGKVGFSKDISSKKIIDDLDSPIKNDLEYQDYSFTFDYIRDDENIYDNLTLFNFNQDDLDITDKWIEIKNSSMKLEEGEYVTDWIESKKESDQIIDIIETRKEVNSWTNWNYKNYLTKTESGVRLTFSNSIENAIQIPLEYPGIVENSEYVTLSFEYKGNITEFGDIYFTQETDPNVFVIKIPNEPTINTEEWQKFSLTFSSEEANIRTNLTILLFHGLSNQENNWIEIKNKSMKLEKGKIATKWVASIDDIMTDIDEKIEVVNKKIEEQKTSFIETSNSIVMNAISSYTKTNDFESFKEIVSSQLEIMSNEININFTNSTENISNIENELESFKEIFSKHISFSENGIVISSGNNVINLQLDNEKGIVFSKNGVEFGYWDGVDFHTGNIIVNVDEKAQFGNFAFLPRPDGSLMFTKVGGD